MRKLIEPAPAARCQICAGTLSLKNVEGSTSINGKTRNVYVCTKCGNERTFAAQRDLYSAQPTVRNMNLPA